LIETTISTSLTVDLGFRARARQGYRALKDEKAEEKDQDKKSGY
jgi:hypothetical protein